MSTFLTFVGAVFAAIIRLAIIIVVLTSIGGATVASMLAVNVQMEPSWFRTTLIVLTFMVGMTILVLATQWLTRVLAIPAGSRR
jgi:hypothetical protein